jgi:hypothetical protein
MKKKCKKKTMKNYIAILAAVIVPFVSHAQTAVQGASATGTTNSTGNFFNMKGSWAVLPHSFTDFPIVNFVQAKLSGPEVSNVTAVVNFYTSTVDPIKPTATTATSGTNITVASTSTNGIVANDVFVLWDAQTDAYYRLVADTPTTSTLKFFETIPVQTDTSDRLFKMSKKGVIGSTFTQVISGPPTYTSVLTASGNVFVGRPGRPVLVEANGTNQPSLNIVTAVAGK